MFNEGFLAMLPFSVLEHPDILHIPLVETSGRNDVWDFRRKTLLY